MAMNSLLPAASSAVLCLHDHEFGHLVVGQHSEEGEDCHESEASEHQHDEDQARRAHAISAENEPHCVDIEVSSTDGSILRALDSTSLKKPLATDIALQSPIIFAQPYTASQIRLVTRAPPAFCSALEQCVRKTVLRI